MLSEERFSFPDSFFLAGLEESDVWKRCKTMPTLYEEFTQEQEALLNKFVTNTQGHVFVLRNLPEVIKGALFSRYSRSTLGLRSLLLKEFINNSDETNFEAIVQTKDEAELDPEQQQFAIKKAQSFYDRILDGYGDDSIGELGGAHLAVENISMIAAKAIEDCRIGGSPLEKSTRYIYFDQKVQGEYLYYREPVLMTSAWRSLYVSTCDMLFDTYTKMIPPLTEHMERQFPQDPNITKTAYMAAIRAKVLDCVRGLLPASTLTNVGIYGNGRFFESMLHKLEGHALAELQEIGKTSCEELSKVIPSFVRRAELKHKHHIGYQKYFENISHEVISFAEHLLTSDTHHEKVHKEPGVALLSYDSDAVYKVAAALLFAHTTISLEELEEKLRWSGREEIGRLFDGLSSCRQNRRHKSPRALERAVYTFEIIADFGTYRDLQRHRMLTQERQMLSCDHGYYLPKELFACGLEGKYKEALSKAKEAYDIIAKELPEEAQYIVPMAFNIRWYQSINLRALQWLSELRSQPAGHPSYRKIARQLTELVIQKEPLFEKFFRFVDYTEPEVGRLQQEVHSEAKRSMLLQEGS